MNSSSLAVAPSRKMADLILSPRDPSGLHVQRGPQELSGAGPEQRTDSGSGQGSSGGDGRSSRGGLHCGGEAGRPSIGRFSSSSCNRSLRGMTGYKQISGGPFCSGQDSGIPKCPSLCCPCLTSQEGCTSLDTPHPASAQETHTFLQSQVHGWRRVEGRREEEGEPMKPQPCFQVRVLLLNTVSGH